jgi:hypothetical protein
MVSFVLSALPIGRGKDFPFRPPEDPDRLWSAPSLTHRVPGVRRLGREANLLPTRIARSFTYVLRV